MKKFELNILTYMLLIIMCITWTLDLFTYLFNIPYIIGLLLSIIVNGIINYFMLKKLKITHNFTKVDIIFYVLLLSIMAITIVYPDRAFDTFNYHLYLQENPFGDKIGFDFFAGKNLNSFSYAFPDRMFYLFRYLLGYRLGVILNYLLVMIIYHNVKDIVKKLIPSIKELPLVFISLFVATSISIIDIVDSYYVDLISLVILLELFRVMFFSKLEKDNTMLFGYIGLLFGFAFVCKISNAFTLIALFIIFIIKNIKLYKYLNVKNVLITMVLFILPFSIYMLYTYVSTGNPFFPFYNTIFKSEYFGLWNWLDKRFGPHNIFEAILWPIIGVLRPGRVNDQAIVEPLWAYGYILSIMYVGYYLFKVIRKQEINKNKLYYFLSTILVYLVWSKFQLGYSRYGLICLVLGGITTSIYIYDIFMNKKILLISIIVPLMFYNSAVNIRHFMGYSEDWIFNNYFNDVTHNYRYNLKNIFSSGDDIKLELESDSVWAIFYYNAGLAQMVDTDIPIVNITSSVENDYTSELLNKKLDSASHIYTLVDSLDFKNFIDSINNYDFEIIGTKAVLDSSIIKRNTSYVYIFEIKRGKDKYKIDNIDTNRVYDVSNQENFSMFLGVPKDSNRLLSSDIEVAVKCDDNRIDELVVSKDAYMLKLNYDVKECNSLKLNTTDSWLLGLVIE